jgi:hypothetical protein
MILATNFPKFEIFVTKKTFVPSALLFYLKDDVRRRVDVTKIISIS